MIIIDVVGDTTYYEHEADQFDLELWCKTYALQDAAHKLTLFDCVIQGAEHVIWGGANCNPTAHAKATLTATQNRVDGEQSSR